MKVIQIITQIVPGPMANTMNIQLFGLGDDGMPYLWDGKKKEWVAA